MAPPRAAHLNTGTMTASIPRPVDFSQYRHIWCVGCSFTSWTHATWADQLARHHPVTNMGKSGAGNQYMFQTLWEMDHAGRIHQDDLIMVQWSSVFRDSRRYRGQWLTGGNLWTQEIYPNDYIRRFCDPEEFYSRDMALIRATQKGLLDRYAHHEISMCPLTQVNQFSTRQFSIDTDYSAITDRILPSFYEVLWDNDIANATSEDLHPTEQEHALYMERVFDWKA